jgi:hypothetical protein
MTESSKVAVAVRIRPLIERFGEGFQVKSAKKATEDTICMTHPSDDSPNSAKQYTYTYNYVFDDEDSQADIYEAVKELVDSSLDGHNATIFTYGQTGSGKTHTVLGQIDNVGGQIRIGTNTGLFMRVLDDLIRYKAANAARTHVVITISILEIHKEILKDLLAKSRVVELQRNRHGDEAVPGLKMIEVKSLVDCFNVFQIGQANRSVAATQSNDVSSRSHAVFMIDILQQEKTPTNPEPPNPMELYSSEFSGAPVSPTTEPVPIRKSRLSLVDLAGSERLKKSGAEGDTLKETQAINTSLACLGNVVNALYEGKNFVGYRDSKLTLLLKPSFERANAKVLLICNISPIANSFSESMGSLRFADRVMGLKAKQVFVLDADSEQEYLDSLRLRAELCADVRLAIATYDLHLHGGRKLRRLRGPDGTFSKDTVAKLNQEHKAQAELQTQQKLQQLVNKLTSKRDVLLLRHQRATKILGLQLKCEELEVVVQTLKAEEAQYDAAIAFAKDEYKILKRMAKNAEKAIAAIKEEVQKTDGDLEAVEQEGRTLLQQIEADENTFAHREEPPPPPPPEPPAPEPVTVNSQPVRSPEETVSPGPPDQQPSSPSADEMARLPPPNSVSLPPRVPKKDDSSDDDGSPVRETAKAEEPKPRSGSGSYTAVDFHPRRLSNREDMDAATKAAADTTAEFRRQREEMWKRDAATEQTVRQLAVTATKLAADDDDYYEEEEEDEEENLERDDTESGDAPKEPKPPKPRRVREKPEPPAPTVDRKRMKELLKASGLKKSEIEKILQRLAGP